MKKKGIFDTYNTEWYDTGIPTANWLTDTQMVGNNKTNILSKSSKEKMLNNSSYEL